MAGAEVSGYCILANKFRSLYYSGTMYPLSPQDAMAQHDESFDTRDPSDDPVTRGTAREMQAMVTLQPLVILHLVCENVLGLVGLEARHAVAAAHGPA